MKPASILFTERSALLLLLLLLLLSIPESGKYLGVVFNSREAVLQYYEYNTQVFNNDNAVQINTLEDNVIHDKT